MPSLPIIATSIAAEQTFESAVELITPNFHMGWDLFLALIPLLVAVMIFKHHRRFRPLVWWPLFLIFMAFLPNAPYVLTDVIHFVDKVRVTPPLPVWAMSLLLLEYFLYFTIGMQSFTLSMMLWGHLLKRHHAGWAVIPVEIIVLGLSALGVFLGRFDRLNSWDLVCNPFHVLGHTVRETLQHRDQMMMGILFLTLFLIYYLSKFSNILVLDLIRPAQHDRSHQQRIAE